MQNKHDLKIKEMQQNLSNLNQRNQQMFREKQELSENMQNNEKVLKLADFTLFIMKLIQRLELQTHNNLNENKKFLKKINDPYYQQNRQTYVDLKLPKTPDELLNVLKKDRNYIDN